MKITPIPITKLPSFPSLRLLAPRANPISARMGHAKGSDIFCWIMNRASYEGSLRLAPCAMASLSSA